MYNQIADECLTCKDGFYLSDNKKSCVLYPNGINGCYDYSSPTVCIQCKENKYLDGGFCKDVLVDDLITDCRFYSSATACLECSVSTTLNGAKCESSNALNCLTIKDTNSCETCSVGFGLK